MAVIRAMCRCGYPFNPDLAYDGSKSWTHHRPRRWCSKRCARSWPAKDRAEARKRERHRTLMRRWEAAGQLLLW